MRHDRDRSALSWRTARARSPTSQPVTTASQLPPSSRQFARSHPVDVCSSHAHRPTRASTAVTGYRRGFRSSSRKSYQYNFPRDHLCELSLELFTFLFCVLIFCLGINLFFIYFCSQRVRENFRENVRRTVHGARVAEKFIVPPERLGKLSFCRVQVYTHVIINYHRQRNSSKKFSTIFCFCHLLNVYIPYGPQ